MVDAITGTFYWICQKTLNNTFTNNFETNGAPTPACWADTVACFIDRKDIFFYGLIVIYRCFEGRERPNFYSSSWAVLMIVACKCFSVLEFMMLSDNYQNIIIKIACRLRTTLSKSKIGLTVVDYSLLFLFFCSFVAYWQWSVVAIWPFTCRLRFYNIKMNCWNYICCLPRSDDETSAPFAKDGDDGRLCYGDYLQVWASTSSFYEVKQSFDLLGHL